MLCSIAFLMTPKISNMPQKVMLSKLPAHRLNLLHQRVSIVTFRSPFLPALLPIQRLSLIDSKWKLNLFNTLKEKKVRK